MVSLSSRQQDVLARLEHHGDDGTGGRATMGFPSWPTLRVLRRQRWVEVVACGRYLTPAAQPIGAFGRHNDSDDVYAITAAGRDALAGGTQNGPR